MHLRLGSFIQCWDPQCNKYIEKFNKKPLMFGKIIVDLNQVPKVNVIIGYSDIDYFNDPDYFGLVNEDGNFSDSICFNLKIYKYTSNTYSDYLEITDLTILASNNSKKKQRYYSFTLEGEKLQQFMVKTSNSHQYIYRGFFAFVFSYRQSNNLQSINQFEIFFTINKSFTTLINQGFKSLYQINFFYNCDPLFCYFFAEKEIKFCADIKCAEYINPDLHFNDKIILYQFYQSQNEKQIYLTHPQVWYVGEGLLEQAKIISFDNTQPGQIKIELKVGIVWNGLKIQVTSSLEQVIIDGELSDMPTPIRVFGQTQQIYCIKAQGSESCATCDEQYLAQGYANNGCSLFGSKISMKFIILSIIILQIFH
ncbi:unnamed protein product [Paramecium pentaurelia]|uniref:Uncharacterized protein n=1 Tax=Paramecium pentaurelia TaxID=43138 RepID=A0A8S1TFY0_9CILI|nr:unnamed protein product [Paramecium pentaurelia]